MIWNDDNNHNNKNQQSINNQQWHLRQYSNTATKTTQIQWTLVNISRNQDKNAEVNADADGKHRLQLMAINRGAKTTTENIQKWSTYINVIETAND